MNGLCVMQRYSLGLVKKSCMDEVTNLRIVSTSQEHHHTKCVHNCYDDGKNVKKRHFKLQAIAIPASAHHLTRNSKVKVRILAPAFGLLLGSLAGICCGTLRVAFYRGKCGFSDVEAIVAGIVATQFFMDPTIAPALLRLHFHDCFVNGCDASILIDGSSGEKTATPNLSVRGYEIIDQAKAAVEKACPGLVSCADLIAIAARDAVFLSGGGRYNVQTGRRDGLISSAQNVSLLGPSVSVSQAIAAFADKGLSPTDMVILLGAHSVGVTHCSFIKDRLYNFQGTGSPDPSMDPLLANALRLRCPKTALVDSTISLDQSPFTASMVDSSYYQNIMLGRGILQIDQELASDPFTRPIVARMADAFDFSTSFGAAMVKLGAIGALTGKEGEIRRSCRATNTPQSA